MRHGDSVTKPDHYYYYYLSIGDPLVNLGVDDPDLNDHPHGPFGHGLNDLIQIHDPLVQIILI